MTAFVRIYSCHLKIHEYGYSLIKGSVIDMRIKMKKLSLLTAIISLLSLPRVVYSQENSQINYQQTFTISQAYARETIPGTQISSAYMTIKNNSEQSRQLIAISSNISPRIEMHQHLITNDGMMKMRKITTIVIPAQQQVQLQPSGLHLMLFDLKKPLISSQIVNMTLHFDNKSTMIVQVPVVSLKQQ